MLFTVGLRTIMSLPAQVTSHKVAAKRTIMFKEINEILPSLKEASEKWVRKIEHSIFEIKKGVILNN